MKDEDALSDPSLTKKEKFDIIIGNNVGLLKKEAKRFSRSNPVCDIEDYEQEARLALFEHIIDGFNPEEGVKFSTYLTTCIRNAIRKQASRFYGPLTMSTKARSIMLRVEKLRDQGFKKREIIKMLGIKEHVYRNARFLSQLTRIEPESSAVDVGVEEIPASIIIGEAGLTEREKKVIELRKTKTLSEVGRELDCSAEWIRKIEMSAFNKVKRVL